jgi:ATP-dependent RNA helicase RhlE
LTFQDLKLVEPLLKSLANEGYTTPTPIQSQAIPVVLEKRDLLGCAQTGTGKTAAFAIPILQLMHEQQTLTVHVQQRIVRTLVLTPTRELAAQIEDNFNTYARFLPFTTAVIFGGVSQHQQVRKLKEGVDILIATPGRLLDLMNQGIISLKGLEFFVLDEADRMLDMGFVHDVKKIIARLPLRKQSLFFSATMPGEIVQLASALLRNPVKVHVTPPSSTVETIRQSLYYVEKHNKISLLAQLLSNDEIKTALVFTRTKHGADKVVKQLHKAGIRAEAIHGNKSQNERIRVLYNFKNNRTKVLVATDIASRGIDIDELGHVFNFDLPESPEVYVHRIGRTGRAGAAGVAVSFCDYDEKILLADIQKLIRKKIDVVMGHAFDRPLMHPAETKAAPESIINNKKFGSRKAGRIFKQRA